MNKKPDIHPDDLMTGNVAYKHSHSLDTLFPEFANDDSIICIYSGPNPGPGGGTIHNIPNEYILNYLLKVIKPGMKIFFDDSYEGVFFGRLTAKIHDIIKDTDINPAQIYYFSNAVNGDELYKKFCLDSNITNPINIYTVNNWEYLTYRVFNSVRDRYNIIQKKEKLFLCFNRRFRLHRAALLGLLLKKDLVKNSYYSYFHDFDKISIIDYLRYYGVTEETSNIIDSELKNNDHLFPLRLNIELEDNKIHIDSDDIKLFDNSYFSLVTETGFFNNEFHYKNRKLLSSSNIIFFSEKIYKPIVVRHPFIIVSSAHSLKYLRKLGYKTFSPFIDESYDDIEDAEERLIAITNEVERLNRFTDSEWIKWQHDVEHILDHNHSIIRTRKINEYAISRSENRTQP